MTGVGNGAPIGFGGTRSIVCMLLGALIGGCATDPLPTATDTPALPATMVVAHDLRGTYRAALCARDDMADDACARTLYRFAGEPSGPRPPAADPAGIRLLFVPGFLASCFPDIHTFEDVAAAAIGQGFAVQTLVAGGRDGIAANARMLAEQIERVPDDGRRIIVVGHSKGAVDVLELIVTRPDLARRIAAVLSVAGALQGSPLADYLHGLYAVTLGAYPFASCGKGEGDAVVDLQPERRREWWAQHGSQVHIPVYAIVSIAQFDHLSPALLGAFAGLSHVSRYNDGMLLAPDQLAVSGRLLGVVDADHLAVAIPTPERLPWSLFFTSTPFPRTQVVLAAVDVIAMELAASGTLPAR